MMDNFHHTKISYCSWLCIKIYTTTVKSDSVVEIFLMLSRTGEFCQWNTRIIQILVFKDQYMCVPNFSSILLETSLSCHLYQTQRRVCTDLEKSWSTYFFWTKSWNLDNSDSVNKSHGSSNNKKMVRKYENYSCIEAHRLKTTNNQYSPVKKASNQSHRHSTKTAEHLNLEYEFIGKTESK